MEALEDRTLPSVSSLLAVFEASPPAAALQAFVESMVEQRIQLIATFVQYASNVCNTLGQEITQEIALLQQQWSNFLGISFNTTDQSLNSAAAQSSDNSDTDQGHASGTGSGSGTMTTGHDGNTQPVGTFKALDVSGTGSGTDSGSSSFNATVTGQVWLDNNGDGALDENEMGYSGAQVNLLYEVGSGGGATWSTLASTTTNSNLAGNNYSIGVVVPPGGSYTCKIDVAFPPYFTSTFPSSESVIDDLGFSPVFSLSPGQVAVKPAGMRSMNVNTLTDDPNGVLLQNTVTLRDAIETGNNGPPFSAVTFDGTPPGTIGLQKALDPIEVSYDIDGPGADNYTVDGSLNAGTIFTVDAGVTSTIRGLTIEGGSNETGGGVLNNGNLKLNSDVIKGNTSIGNGGGIDNGNGTLTLSGVQILGNNAADSGGGLYNAGGTVTITGGTLIKGNNALDSIVGHGGGIDNNSGTVTISGGTVISTNSAGVSGGGVHNLGTFYMTSGQISSNTAPPSSGGGGGVDNLGSMRLLGVAVQGNSAGEGGGISTWLGKLVLGQNTTVSGNKASKGAGIWVQSGTAAMVGGGVTNNTAQQSGGGIYVYGGQLWLQSGVLVSTNTAVGNGGGGQGGGIYINGGTVTVSGGKILGNGAWDSGGGIYNLGGTLKLDDSVNIHANGATIQGGGIYLAAPSVTTFDNAAVFDNQTNGSQQTTGWGVYWQNNATVTLPINLIDSNDPNGIPVKGP